MVFARGICCHYCGARSKYAPGAVSVFTCTECEADNHVNNKGEIVDFVPATPRTFVPQTFSRASEAPQSSESLPFCRKCLQNQHIVKEMCAEYVWNEADSDEVIEKKYKAFKEDAERRYPPCCLQCESAALQKLQKAEYDAKCHQLAINLAKAQRGQSYTGVMRMEDSWTKFGQRVWLRIVGAMWWTSLVVELLWHFMGALATPRQDDFAMEPEPVTIASCVKSIGIYSMDHHCASDFAVFIPKVLIASLLVIWYTPNLHMLAQPSLRRKRLIGMDDYLRTQIVALVLRTTVWYNIAESNTWALTDNAIRSVHIFMGLFLVSVNIVSSRIVELKDRATTTSSKTGYDLIDPVVRQNSPPQHLDTHTLSSGLFQRQPAAPFPIHLLGEQSPKLYTPRTKGAVSPLSARFTSDSGLHSPPVSEDMSIDDEMDVDTPPAMGHLTLNRSSNLHFSNYRSSVTNNVPLKPSKGILQLQAEERAKQEAQRALEQRRKQTSLLPNEDSPFRGTLPPAPISPAHYLRNPPRQPTFNKTPLSQQQDFWEQMKLKPTQNTVDSTGHPSSQPVLMRKDKQEMELHNSGWRLQSDFQQDPDVSELGNLFGGGNFSLGDEPDERPSETSPGVVGWYVYAGAGLLLALGMWNVQAIRRPLCLWLASKL